MANVDLTELFGAIDTYITRKYGPKIKIDPTGHARPVDGNRLGPHPTPLPPSPIGIARALSQPDVSSDLSDEQLGLTPQARKDDGTIDFSLIR